MNFLADMGISGLTVEWLRQQGHVATHLRDEGLQRLTDDLIVEKARSEEKIILTVDLDFGYLMSVSKQTLPSVIIFRLSDERAEFVNLRLGETLVNFEEALISGAIVSVSDTRIRVRRLPI